MGQDCAAGRAEMLNRARELVPAHRLLDFMAIRGGPSPGSAVNPGYLYRLPMYGMFSFNLVGCAIGAARARSRR